MKKRILSVLLCGILLANLAGCAGKSQSASDVSDESAFQAEQTGKTEAAAQTDSSPASSQEEQTAPESVEETASTQPPAEEEKETPQEQTEGKKPASANPNQAPSRQEREPEPAKPSEPERPAETVPAQTAAPENKPEPAPSEPVAQEQEPTQTEPAFDIGYWVSYAKSYAQGVGLALDSGAVYCWDNPITAGSHCIYLERDITNRLNRYSNDGSITQVWMWAEDRGDGSYDLYIGYA